MAQKIRVLVFPAGEINSVELHDALSSCVNIELYGASSSDRHGGFVFQRYISGLPNISEAGFLDAFNAVLEENGIDVVIPTHDDVVLYLTRRRGLLRAKIAAGDARTAEICRDKRETYRLFEDMDFCPKVYDAPPEAPVFIKPRRGQGGVGAQLLTDAGRSGRDIPLSDYVICEYLPGEEYTVDCFTDRNGRLLAALPRSRQRVFGGVTVRGRSEELTEEIGEIAEAINQRLRFLGLWYFQIKRGADGRFKLLEISARCAGTMCLSRAAGVNLPLLSVYAAAGRDVEILRNSFAVTVDRTLISRYQTDLRYRRVYIDLDDTILTRGKVHLPAIRFLYQCANKGTEAVLLTRHAADRGEPAELALRKARIARELFSEIVELPPERPKYAAIDPEGAIFIDNAFAERKAVHDHLGIPVFDVDGIEVLLDWRS